MAGAAKTVFLDRDGVINKKALEGEYITKWSSFEFLPHVFNAIKILKNAGYKVIVVTNQRGVALHKMSMDDVDNIHR
ncbi:MAG: HAD-IIIA family hydrolase [Acidaminococcus sp.]|jgi:D-glycero-D-manno-heptose 1,7-bisphosphate phosphatase|nr:HAD-IIIA family hydrolase [Acidaminococcus sp.]MCI2116448.1 HAD-IIIA family hydrolase [Acidaminococcus sp.]